MSNGARSSCEYCFAWPTSVATRLVDSVISFISSSDSMVEVNHRTATSNDQLWALPALVCDGGGHPLQPIDVQTRLGERRCEIPCTGDAAVVQPVADRPFPVGLLQRSQVTRLGHHLRGAIADVDQGAHGGCAHRAVGKQ